MTGRQRICDGCGNKAPRGKRICRPCRRRLAQHPPTLQRRVGLLDIPCVITVAVASARAVDNKSSFAGLLTNYHPLVLRHRG